MIIDGIAPYRWLNLNPPANWLADVGVPRTGRSTMAANFFRSLQAATPFTSGSSLAGVIRASRIAPAPRPGPLDARRERSLAGDRRYFGHSTGAISSRHTGPFRYIAPWKRTKAGTSPATSQ